MQAEAIFNVVRVELPDRLALYHFIAGADPGGTIGAIAPSENNIRDIRPFSVQYFVKQQCCEVYTSSLLQ